MGWFCRRAGRGLLAPGRVVLFDHAGRDVPALGHCQAMLPLPQMLIIESAVSPLVRRFPGSSGSGVVCGPPVYVRGCRDGSLGCYCVASR